MKNFFRLAFGLFFWETMGVVVVMTLIIGAITYDISVRNPERSAFKHTCEASQGRVIDGHCLAEIKLKGFDR